MKKIMAVVAALAIMTVGTTAFAAESPTAGSTKVEADTTQEAVVGDVTTPSESVEKMAENTKATAAGLTITSEPVQKTTVSEAGVAALDAISNLSDLADVLGSETLKAAASDSTKKVNADVKAVVNLDVTSGSIPTSGITITIKNENIVAGKVYAILHYTNNEWQTIKATNVQTGSLDIFVKDLSPIAIVEVSVEEITTDASSSESSIVSNTSTGTKTTASKDAATTDADASPKTGETTPLALIGLMVCVAGAFACAKKSQHN